MTGETISIPTFDHVKIERISDLPKMTEGLKRYSVLASGEWRLENPPLALFTTDEVPLDGAWVCEASCHVRSEPVSTSCWDYEAGPNIRNVPHFGEACEATGMAGIVSNPWTGEVIEVPHAGCARFWIEFEFGKFLLPKIGFNLDVFDAVMVAKIEECFGTKFVQGCRFN